VPSQFEEVGRVIASQARGNLTKEGSTKKPETRLTTICEGKGRGMEGKVNCKGQRKHLAVSFKKGKVPTTAFRGGKICQDRTDTDIPFT